VSTLLSLAIVKCGEKMAVCDELENTGKDAVLAYFIVFCPHLLGGTEETHRKP
jgi:hypothetical protein